MVTAYEKIIVDKFYSGRWIECRIASTKYCM